MWLTDYRSQSPCNHAKTVLESLIIFCVHRPYDMATGEWSRVMLSENRFFVLYLLHRVVGNITNEQISILSETYETDLVCNFDEFNWEIARCRTRTLVYNISRVLPWRSISVLRLLKSNVRSKMNNDRLLSLVLLHVHRDFFVNVDKLKEKLLSA